MTTRPADPMQALQGTTHWIYQSAMAAMAVAVIAMLPLADRPWTTPVNLAIWGVFVVDYTVRLALSGNRRTFVRGNLADLIAIMPLDFLRAARIVRLVRLVRIARSAAVLWRVSSHTRGILKTNGLGWVLACSVLLILSGGLAIYVVEPEIGSVGDAVWWALVTATTVGYGDLSPATVPGRAVAGVLMIAGIGVIGMITGSIATYFIGGRREQHPHVEFVRSELARWDELDAAERSRLVTLLADLSRSNAASHREHRLASGVEQNT